MTFQEKYKDMMDQAVPGEALKAAVIETGAGRKKSPARPLVLAAGAVCATVVLAIPVWRVLRPEKTALHSFIQGQAGTVFTETAAAGTTEEGTEEPQDPAPDTDRLGDPDRDGGDPENTGETMPGGAMVPVDEPVDAASQQEAVMAYQNLMAWFGDEGYGEPIYPEWYGGAYVSGSMLIVCVADPEGTLDKEFFLQVQTWAGGGERTDAVGFSDAKYSLNHLLELQEKIAVLLDGRPGSWWCGVDQMAGRVELSVSQADEALLAALAELDPEDDAILVQVDPEGSVILTETEERDPMFDEVPAPAAMDEDPAADDDAYDGTHYE